MKTSNLLGAVCACLFSTIIDAALIERDWVTAGDDLLIYDPATNLEWLDISRTVGFSYDDIVNNKLSAGGEFAGFSYADRDEVRTLFENAGIGEINQVPSSVYFDNIITLANMLGGGRINGQGALDVQGISGEAAPAGTGANWAPFLFWTPDPCINCDPNLIPGEGLATLNGTLSPVIGYTDQAGSWLIREASVIPIPATIWLFSSGLIGLIAMARRKKAA